MTSLRIGDLARLGGVSVRMLRHYHQIELLVPAEIDGTTGYRSYDTTQLDTVRRIVTLKNLGLSLSQIDTLINGDVSDEELRAVFVTRRKEMADELALAESNLRDIDQILADLANPVSDPQEKSASNASIEVELKSVPAKLVAQMSAISESWAPSDIGPTIQPLYRRLLEGLEETGVTIVGPSTARYEDTEDGRVRVYATLEIAERPEASNLGFEVVELPSMELVASVIHTGDMDNCEVTYLALHEWIASNGHQSVGYAREMDIEYNPGKEWITEIQQQLRLV